MSSATTSAPTHQTESISDRRKAREMAEARQGGQLAPEVDVKTGAMINPHNPEFITRRPWYLGGNDTGPSLSHQSNQKSLEEQDENKELSLSSADALVKLQRKEVEQSLKSNNIQKGMWIEALRKNRKPYQMCQVVSIKKNTYKVKFEDGFVEAIKFNKNNPNDKKLRVTKAGNRSYGSTTTYGKETYDSKRDAYHGFDVTTKAFTKNLEDKFAQRDAIRRKLKTNSEDKINSEEKKGSEHNSGEGTEEDDSDYDSDNNSDSEDEFVQKDADNKIFTSRTARQGGVGGAEMKFTIRNLRIREDTAKYLRNLDINSAYYDPKSRSMRDNPYDNQNTPAEELPFAGDNFTRITGDAVDLAKTQLFAWEAESKGNTQDLHPQANPSKAELLRKKFQSKSQDVKLEQKKALLKKYGGAEYLDGSQGLAVALDSSSDMNSHEFRKTRLEHQSAPQFYSKSGNSVTATQTKMPVLKSKYQEDIFVNGHTTVWGSYFHKGAFRWGYADDHSLLKNSYCTGEVGREANDKANELQYGSKQDAALQQAREMLQANTAAKKRITQQPPPSAAKLYGEVDDQHVSFDKEKMKQAMEKAKNKTSNQLDDRKRKYNSLESAADTTQEDMEVYRLNRKRTEDPMANFTG